ncbi:MAG: hypothetical protein J5803_02210 [Desulfovibrio sp.]|nr:hypothetical protein [Desulfovibrio sp.]
MSEHKKHQEECCSPDYTGSSIHIYLQPEEHVFSMPRVKTVWQLLEKLNLPEETALVARDGQLLTPDRHLYPCDHILVRKVGSRG